MSLDKRYVKLLDDSFTISDVGSTLLEHLAQGLYQPSEVVREYVQNAVDAHRLYRDATGSFPEQPIGIEISRDTLSFFDFGIGMDAADIKKVKSIAVSNKRDANVQLTGHKGVGIWAGLSYFDTLTLVTTKRGSAEEYKLTISFNKIVEAISPEVDIGEALNPNYSIEVYKAKIEEHYTIVRLERPRRSSEQFLDPERVKDAVRHICPCEIDSSFVYAVKMTDWYREHNLEIFAIEVNGERVFRSYPSAIEHWTTGELTVNDIPVAEYWYAIHQTNGKLNPASGQLVGFRLVQNGFTLGETNPYSEPEMPSYSPLPRNQYPNWYIGEVHITSPNLRPNLQRNRLEESEGTRQFIERFRSFYRGIESHARLISKKRETFTTYSKIMRQVAAFLSRVRMDLSGDEQRFVVQTKKLLEEQDAQARSRKQDTDTEAFKADEVKNMRRKLLSDLGLIYKRHHDEHPDQSEMANAVIANNGSSLSTTRDETSETESRPSYSQRSHPPLVSKPTQASLNTSPSMDATSVRDIRSNTSDTAGAQYDQGDDIFADEESSNAEAQAVPLSIVFALLEQVLQANLQEEAVCSLILQQLRTQIEWAVPNDKLK